MCELRRLKQDNHTLQQEKQYLKVQADKYRNRAIALKSKYQRDTETFQRQLQTTMKETKGSEADYRLKNTTLKSQLKTT